MPLNKVFARLANAVNGGKGGLFSNSGAPIGGRPRDKYSNPGVPITLAASAGYDILGPAEGYLRFFEIIYAQPIGSTPILDFSLIPPLASAMFFGRGINLGGATVIGSFIPTAFGSRQVVIGEGEKFHVDNVGTASCKLWFSYYDFPNTNRYLVRTQVTDVLTTLIPAAPTGYYHKPLLVAYTAPAPSAVIYNDDTATAQIQMYNGADYIWQSNNNITAGTSQTLVGLSSLDTTITDQPRRAKTVVAPTTRPLNAAICYERFKDEALDDY